MVKPRTDFDHRARKLLFSNVLFYRLLLSKTGVASKRLYVISLYFSARFVPLVVFCASKQKMTVKVSAWK